MNKLISNILNVLKFLLIIFMFSVVIVSNSLWATELKPFMKDGKLGVVIYEIKFPENISKDLVSGLTNKILIRIDAVFNSQSIQVNREQFAEITIKYDLWEESFKVTTKSRGIKGNQQETIQESLLYKNIKDVMAFLSKIKLLNLFTTTELTNSGIITLQAEVILNPIEKEQMEKIKNWVAKNSSASPLDPTGFGSAKPVTASRSNTLFNKIYEQYASGARVASIWKEHVTSDAFYLSKVIHEK
ncbi:MAG: hypothetical protein HQK51_21490 [Oligoflexia bacterium]|nr:hypothetical protein [Oligoflexia bacterium]